MNNVLLTTIRVMCERGATPQMILDYIDNNKDLVIPTIRVLCESGSPPQTILDFLDTVAEEDGNNPDCDTEALDHSRKVKIVECPPDPARLMEAMARIR